MAHEKTLHYNSQVNEITKLSSLKQYNSKETSKVKTETIWKANARSPLVIVYIYGKLWSNMKHKIFQVFIRRWREVAKNFKKITHFDFIILDGKSKSTKHYHKKFSATLDGFCHYSTHVEPYRIPRKYDKLGWAYMVIVL